MDDQNSHQNLLENPNGASPAPAIGYWRPGCPYCAALMDDMHGDSRVVWTDVWENPDASDMVKSLNDGNELVPTVVVGEQVLRNPSASDLRAALDARA